MPSDLLKYPRGSVIEFSSGEYSDYRTVGIVVTLKDCDLPALAQAFAEQERAEIAARGDTSWGRERLDGFPAWLIAHGYAMPVEAAAVHLGGYSEWEPEFGVPAWTPSDDE